MFRVFKPFINNVKNLISNNSRPVPKDPRKIGKFSEKYSELEKPFADQNKTLQRTQHASIQGQPLQIKVVHTRAARIKQCGAVALTAPKISLPKNCIADEHLGFLLLLNAALSANPNKKRITVWELVQFVKKHQHSKNKKHPVRKFIKYMGNDFIAFRQFSKDWLQTQAREAGLSKTMTDYGGPNSAEHGEYLKQVGLTDQNIDRWCEELLEDRCYLPIHSFEMAGKGKGGFRVNYHVPIALRPCAYSQTPYASNSSQFFQPNTDLVDMVLVFEYLQDKSQAGVVLFKEGILITAFLHNLPLKKADIINLQWVSQGVTPWGGSLTATNNYINTLGKTGMRSLKKSFNFFPLLNTVPTPNRSSQGNKIEDHYRNLPGNLNKKTIFIYKIDPVTKKINKNAIQDIVGISKDSAYIRKAIKQFSSYRQQIERKFLAFWKQL